MVFQTKIFLVTIAFAYLIQKLINYRKDTTMMITLSGPIGAGKTTLTRLLASQLGTKAFEEPVGNNPILPLFYSGNEEVARKKAQGDTKATNRYAFLLQIYYLNQRFDLIKQALQNDNNVLDRSIYEDNLFMHMNTKLGNATEQEYAVYKHLLNNMMQELPYAAHKKGPDLMIYIHLDYPTMIHHIETRDRPYEQINSDPSLVNYYQTLLKEYSHWTKTYDQSPLMTIDATKYDFVKNIEDTRHVLNSVYDQLFFYNKISPAKLHELREKAEKLTKDDIPITD